MAADSWPIRASRALMAAYLDNRLAHPDKHILRMLIVVPYERTYSAAAAPTGHAGPAAPAAEREDSTMKRTWMAALAVAGFGLALATAANARPAPRPHAYPDGVVGGYFSGCLAAQGTPGLCACSIKEIQRRFTYEQFLHIAARMEARGEAFPPELIPVAVACAPQAGGADI